MYPLHFPAPRIEAFKKDFGRFLSRNLPLSLVTKNNGWLKQEKKISLPILTFAIQQLADTQQTLHNT